MIPILFLAAVTSTGSIELYPGYISRIECEGKLILSSVGNEQLVRLEALPKELGCGVLLKPSGAPGRTNLILETTTGTIDRIVEIGGKGASPKNEELRAHLRKGSI